MDAKEIIHCAVQLERSLADGSYGTILTLLGDLDKSQVTAEQLETTDIVKVLYRLLRSCSDDSVKQTAKGVLSKWKRQYSKGAHGVKSKEASRSVSPPHEAGDGGVSKQEDSHFEVEASCSFSSVRSKCVQLLLSALCPEPPDQHKATDLAADIEKHVHELHTPSQVKYKACVRSRVANLRNPKHKHLRQGLLSGALSPEVFSRMSAEEMAGAELRQLREEYSSRGVSERQLPQGVDGTQTQKIRCKNCGGSDCRVTQVSRGALFLPAWVRQSSPDDDSMTFVTCSGCGQQWYHSGWVCL
ncbi:Transcription elongation factor A N-terminal and central domain containing protein [Dissostichus eleginoides]|uniref:Transcription elongation factor A N-terminal and central domain containing protein n=1 Tax=Dissostichus eleginoides TaxID=100907 RepID=A0AAD9ETM2_DISEL|nr:Transcription elongation factor A N-terminal and central domain containing protein [Dissostichus eleginoides]